MISRVLSREDDEAWRLGYAIKGTYLDAMEADILTRWAQQDTHGPRILATICTVAGTPLPELTRQILAGWGEEAEVRSRLTSSFSSGSWSGSEARWLQDKLQEAREWARDSTRIVGKWAEELIKRIEKILPNVQTREEEEMLES